MPKSATERVREHQQKCDAIMLRPYKEEGQRIRDAAQRAGMSVQGYILSAVRDKMRAAEE